MKEMHFAYKISSAGPELVCTQFEIAEDKMLDLLKEIKDRHFDGLYWIFTQFGDKPKEPMCLIDCHKNRVYYHYSGNVDTLEDAIKNLER